jgi:glycosyltransferase involved in cell wall biosynthesis
MTAPRKSVMVLCGFYLPGFVAGGPIRSISSMIENLCDEFDFHVITSNHDLNSAIPYENIASGQWNRIGKANVFYLPDGVGSLFRIARLLRDTHHDMLYLNSFFSPKYTIWPLLLSKLHLIARKPTLLASRGEFSDGALGLKAFKKYIYRKVSTVIGLYDHIFWHASTPAEKSDIIRNHGVGSESILTSRVLVASDMATANVVKDHGSDYFKVQQSDTAIRICFLSRISPMKNLEFAIKVLSEVDVPVIFTIYGPKENLGYWSQCQAVIEQLPANISVQYAGPVDSDAVVETIAKHDLLFVPTLGENFGHVFIESWSAGVPVLISDRTPWRNLASQNIGWDLSLDNVKPFIAAIQEAVDWSPEKRLQVSEACRTMAQGIIFDDSAIESNRNLFLTVLEKPLP